MRTENSTDMDVFSVLSTVAENTPSTSLTALDTWGQSATPGFARYFARYFALPDGAPLRL